MVAWCGQYSHTYLYIIYHITFYKIIKEISRIPLCDLQKL